MSYAARGLIAPVSPTRSFYTAILLGLVFIVGFVGIARYEIGTPQAVVVTVGLLLVFLVIPSLLVPRAVEWLIEQATWWPYGSFLENSVAY